MWLFVSADNVRKWQINKFLESQGLDLFFFGCDSGILIKVFFPVYFLIMETAGTTHIKYKFNGKSTAGFVLFFEITFFFKKTSHAYNALVVSI